MSIDVEHKITRFVEEHGLFTDKGAGIFALLDRVRHETHTVQIGNVKMGGCNPVVVQSMAISSPSQLDKAVAEGIELHEAGSELIRYAINSDAAIKAIPYLRDELVKAGCMPKVIVGCGQYEIARLLSQYPQEAQAMGKIRVNPGNVGFGNKHDKQFAQIVEYCIKYNKPMRIGVNWGSLDPSLRDTLMTMNAKIAVPFSSDVIERQALVMSALLSAKFAESLGMRADKIVISCKVSRVQDLVSVYRSLASLSKYALHLGLTEAGMGENAIVATSMALGILLQEGIGDTIRASLTPEIGGKRSDEVKLCKNVLQGLGIRNYRPSVTSCPGCGRTSSDYFRKLTMRINDYVDNNIPKWKESYQGFENLKIAVMGCIVNGPGESKHADIGISLPGDNEKPIAPVFIDGKKVVTLRGENIASEFEELIDKYVAEKYTR